MGESVVRPEQADVPVLHDVDVVVVGGGPGGIGAAVAAARQGASTLLCEQYGFLGGMATAGLVNQALGGAIETAIQYFEETR